MVSTNIWKGGDCSYNSCISKKEKLRSKVERCYLQFFHMQLWAEFWNCSQKKKKRKKKISVKDKFTPSRLMGLRFHLFLLLSLVSKALLLGSFHLYSLNSIRKEIRVINRVHTLWLRRYKPHKKHSGIVAWNPSFLIQSLFHFAQLPLVIIRMKHTFFHVSLVKLKN